MIGIEEESGLARRVASWSGVVMPKAWHTMRIPEIVRVF